MGRDRTQDAPLLFSDQSWTLVRPRSLPLPGVWPYDTTPPSVTLCTSFHRDVPGLSSHSWSLPELDCQEKPEKKLERSDLKFEFAE
ncbi:hypothetical protein BT69DRAFT_342728 [Atractiella rhizophila]|nr:hypothetical protein BT69DRAFT_342728 [Atractiella rhizophila]